MVVAADKGTAHLSDTANKISMKRGFWLQDAFASGGSDGYDHKEVGITARGAWESVKLHFLEQKIDIQTTEFTVVGIGDMAGDVFGNGMLLSKYILLKAAFNHIHIFIDPAPQAASSWKERERLFLTSGSTWMDYDRQLISLGGGIFERTAKSIVLSPEMKSMLAVDLQEVTGERLIQLLLQCEVDLLWNGGIGTYIMASGETAHQVGDPANDQVRVDATQARAKVIGEGGNLGLTQLARIEAASCGILLNTDAIDNSGGVDTSDHEVNIKILLDSLVRHKKIKSREARNQLLQNLAEEVTELCLQDNRLQGQIISMDNFRSRSDIKPFQDLIHHLTKAELLNPRTEFIPNDKQLELYFSDDIGAPRPVLAVLLSYTKMFFYKEIVKSETLHDPYLESFYINYFPKKLQEQFELSKEDHPLRKEIIGTVLINQTINQAGITLLPVVMAVIDKPALDIVIVYTVMDHVFELAPLREQIMSEFHSRDINAAYRLLQRIEVFLQNILIWMLIRFDSHQLSFSMIKNLEKPIHSYKGILQADMTASQQSRYLREMEAIRTMGASQELAEDLALLVFLEHSLEVIYLSQEAQLPLNVSLDLSRNISDLFKFQQLQTHLVRIEPDTEWSKKHRGLLMQQAQLLKQKLSESIIKEEGGEADFTRKINSFKEKHHGNLIKYFRDFKQFEHSDSFELSGVAVLLNQIATLLL